MYINIEALSGICGSISIAAWVVVYSPQIIENFRRSSTEALSLAFLIIWSAGDIFNLLGALLQGVLPTMIILAAYYILADVVLILQVVYYRGFMTKKPEGQDSSPSNVSHGAAEPTESSALLPHAEESSSSSSTTTVTATNTNKVLPQTRAIDGVHLSPATPLHPQGRDLAALKGESPIQKRQSLVKTIFFNTTAILVVCAAGVLGWWLSTRRMGHRHEEPVPRKPEHEDGDSQRTDLEFSLLGQIFGYICALLYLGSRAPQLLLNYRRKSTDGISMLFFIFACIGNATYVMSILAYEPSCFRQSQKLAGPGPEFESQLHKSPAGCGPGEAGQLYARNFLVNLSWLLGSFGTLLLDVGVFWQWYIYRKSGSKVADTVPAESEANPEVYRESDVSM